MVFPSHNLDSIFNCKERMIEEGGKEEGREGRKEGGKEGGKEGIKNREDMGNRLECTKKNEQALCTINYLFSKTASKGDLCTPPPSHYIVTFPLPLIAGIIDRASVGPGWSKSCLVFLLCAFVQECKCTKQTNVYARFFLRVFKRTLQCTCTPN